MLKRMNLNSMTLNLMIKEKIKMLTSKGALGVKRRWKLRDFRISKRLELVHRFNRKEPKRKFFQEKLAWILLIEGLRLLNN